jgi:hypothetical protein
MTRLRGLAPLLVAAALTVVAVATVQQAGCDDPGRYERSGSGYVLVGGCVAPGDIVVPEPAQRTPATVDTNAPAKS